jgi:hypothetical protein
MRIKIQKMVLEGAKHIYSVVSRVASYQTYVLWKLEKMMELGYVRL